MAAVVGTAAAADIAAVEVADTVAAANMAGAATTAVAEAVTVAAAIAAGAAAGAATITVNLVLFSGRLTTAIRR
jgi:hypothetical protein